MPDEAPVSLHGWFESQDAAAALTLYAALADQTLQVAGDDIIVPEERPYVAGAYAYNAAGTAAAIQAVLRSPRLQPVDAQLWPVSATVEPATPAPWLDMLDGPLRLKAGEPLNHLQDGNGAANGGALVWLAPGALPDVAPPEDARWVRFVTAAAAMTATTAAGGWATNVRQLTRAAGESALPEGSYGIYGMRAWVLAGSAFAVRLAGKGFGSARPGVLVGDLQGDDLTAHVRRLSRIGRWGTLDPRNLPQTEWLLTGSDNIIQRVDLLLDKET